MVKFLNRDGIIKALKGIFDTAECEIIIVVPYVKLSTTSYSLLKNANDRGIEITIVYKEGTLNDIDRNKLKELNNLNLLTHPDIHSKCYCNEELMVIGSMNLYEYSERYNREMAILINIGEMDEGIWQDNTDTEGAYREAIDEIRTITTSSKFEKKSSGTLKKGFNLKILKPDLEYVQLACNYLNKYFDNKKFVVNNDLEIICSNYVDQIEIVVDYSEIEEENGEFEIDRIIIRPKWDKIILDKVPLLTD